MKSHQLSGEMVSEERIFVLWYLVNHYIYLKNKVTVQKRSLKRAISQLLKHRLYNNHLAKGAFFSIVLLARNFF